MTVLLHQMLDGTPADRTAIVDRAGAWSYARLAKYSHAAGAWLAGRKVRRGDRIVVAGVADKRIAALLYGCSRIGAMLVPVSDALTAYQRSQIIADAEPALVVDQLDAVWGEIRSSGSDGAGGTEPAPAEPAILFYTSGTTGRQKAVVAPHRQVWFTATAIQRRLGYWEDDVVFCRLPLNFDYGLYQILLSVLARATLVLADPADDPRLAIRLREHRATVVPIVPALASMLVRLGRRSAPVPGVRLLTNTGEALPRATIDQLKEVFPAAAVQLMFGLTECKRVSILEPDGYLRKPGSVGKPLDGTSVTIVDEADRPVPPGVVGEIVVRGPHVADGYWRAPDLTARKFFDGETDARRGLRTGDLGYLDADGYLYFQGRRDQLFKYRGVRISVAEIEAAATLIPQVEEVAVLPPQDGGQLLLYAVSAREPAYVLAELKALIGPQKLPDACHVVTELPRGTNGKVDRAALRQRALKERVR